MAKFNSPLDRVKIAAPCPADWNQMFGSERVRFCSQCNLNVYNLSGMTRSEAEALLVKTEERLCVRFFRRADGTILTQNCPVGLKAIKRRIGRAADALLWMALSLISGLGFYSVISVRDRAGFSTPLSGTMGALISPTKSTTEPRPLPEATPGEDVRGQVKLPLSQAAPTSDRPRVAHSP